MSYMYIKPQGKKRQPLGTIFMQAERPYHFDHGCMFKKIALPSGFMYIFMISYMYIALGHWQTAH